MLAVAGHLGGALLDREQLAREAALPMTTSPSGTSFDSAKAATCLSSSSDASEKSGMRFSWVASIARATVSERSLG